MPRNFSRGFTLLELLLVIVVIAILASIAYPVYTAIQERARITQDMNNLHEIGLAILVYLNDNDQVLPARLTWPGTSAAPTPTPGLYTKYIGTRRIFQSPFDKRPSSEAADGTPPVSYGINANMYATTPGINRNMSSVLSPASTILMAPYYAGNPTAIASWTSTAGNAFDLPVGGAGGNTSGPQSNAKKINALFCDTHVESMTFGPSSVVGSFQDATSDPLGLKHWDPTK
jgi:prepilin-type N-terminal cleavage/methylation domain-containing protein/prepilin-type processing-associated H-X9-DG protein